MGYSDDECMVRVDFFKPSGKWGYTEAVRMTDYRAPFIHDALRDALVAHLRNEDGTLRLSGMTAVCLEPHHKDAHPIMLFVPERAGDAWRRCSSPGEDPRGGLVRSTWAVRVTRGTNTTTVSGLDEEAARGAVRRILDEEATTCPADMVLRRNGVVVSRWRASLGRDEPMPRWIEVEDVGE